MSLADTSVSLSLANPGPSTITAGRPVTIEVRGTFDVRLSGVAFALGASGGVSAEMIDRASTLAYAPVSTPDPTADDLPHNLTATPKLEVLFDNDFDAAAGGATDGLAAGPGVLIETFTIRASGVGTLNLSLSNVTAVHTTGPPTGALFDVMSVGIGALSLTVVPGAGDIDGDGFITLADYAQLPACLKGPNVGPPPGMCSLFDAEPDNDVDMRDVAAFQWAFGPPSLVAKRTAQVPNHRPR